MDTTFKLIPKLQRTAGIDVHTSKMNVCVMDRDGNFEAMSSSHKLPECLLANKGLSLSALAGMHE